MTKVDSVSIGMANKFREYILDGDFSNLTPTMSMKNLLYTIFGVPIDEDDLNEIAGRNGFKAKTLNRQDIISRQRRT